jgi:thiamine biosynthesis lipoprotein ApbE/Na+-translocating ferredoxin:NAD+ oxidoreductase RnfG subunit
MRLVFHNTAALCVICAFFIVGEEATATAGNIEKASRPLSRKVFEQLWEQEVELDEVTLQIQGQLRTRIAQRARVAVNRDPIRIFRIRSARTATELGHALVLEEIGKYRPITFLVALDATDRVIDLQVLIYREHIGQAIKSPRFTRQFREKDGQSMLKLHRDIRNLAGATLSARATVRAVRRALATIQETVRSEMTLQWKPAVLAATADSIPVENAVEMAQQSISRARPAMGTMLRIEAYGTDASRAIDAAFKEVDRLENLLSRWRPGTDVVRVENAPAGIPVQVSSATIECVEAALSVARESSGAFDPTLVSGGYKKVIVDESASTITLLGEDLVLDLGGIAKGFALDRVGELLESQGISAALLDFGGQLLALDPPPGKSAWDVGIFDPRQSGTLLLSVALVRASLATSADYEKGSHIVDPRRGTDAAVALSTTILARGATLADATSTMLAVLGPEFAERVVTNLPGGAAVILVAGEDAPRVFGELPR